MKNFFEIYRISNNSLAIDLYFFGYRFRWYPSLKYFGVRKMERLLRG